MARETKAQKEARLAEAREAAALRLRDTSEMKTLNDSMMKYLESACELGLELRVSNSKFVVINHCCPDGTYDEWSFPKVLETYVDRQDFLFFVDHVEILLLAKAEAERKASLRRSALDKLTAEEKEALGF